MDVPKQNVSVVRSSVDQSIHFFYLTVPLISQHPQIRLHCKPGDLVKRGAPILDLSLSTEQQFSIIKSPLAGHLLNQGLIVGSLQKEQKKLLFSIKECQHYPRENAPVQQNQPKTNTPIFSAIQYCAFCDEPLWSYYQKQANSLTYSQLVAKFDQFDIDDFEWKVNLNEHFTKNTDIGSTSDEQFSLPCSGKPVFLQNISAIKKQSNINPNHVMMKYKKVICKHEKISNSYCHHCLMSIADIGVDKFKRYLFQVASESIDHSIIVSGKALEEQEYQFKDSIISKRKALFILDLDNTILHSIQLFKVPEDIRQTINDYMIIPPEADSFIERSFVKIRPYFAKFLELILPLYQIYVYTKGTRLYAEQICKAIRSKYSHLLNSSQNFTRTTLVSRDQDPNPKKSLNFILPNLKDFILILDDRRDVWDHSPLCIFTKAYYYFFFCANVEGKEKIEVAEWQKGGGSLTKIPKQEHTVPKHEKQQCNQNALTKGSEEQSLKNGEQKEMIEAQKKMQSKQEKLSLKISSTPDCFLLYAALTMIKSHQMYFRSREGKQCQKRKTGKYADMAHVQKQIRLGILKGKRVYLMIPNYKVSNNTYRRAIKLGVQILENSQSVPDFVVRSNDYRKNTNQFKEISMKLKNYGQANKIPIVSQSWIDLCYQYCYPFPHDNFICYSPSSIMMYPKPELLEDIINKTLEQNLPYVKKQLKMDDKQLISQ